MDHLREGGALFLFIEAGSRSGHFVAGVVLYKIRYIMYAYICLYIY